MLTVVSQAVAGTRSNSCPSKSGAVAKIPRPPPAAELVAATPCTWMSHKVSHGIMHWLEKGKGENIYS